MDWVKSCWVGRRLTALQLEQGTLNHLPVVNPGVQEPWTYLEAKQKHCWGHARALHMVSTSYASYGLYPSFDASQVPTLLGVVASVCTPLPTQTQQLPTLMAQQCWEMCPFKVALRLCHTVKPTRRKFC